MSQQVEFGILGPLEVRVAGRAVPVPPGRQQTVLATLLLRADRPVSVDFLVDAVWGDRPPATATNQIACCVCRLRRALIAAGADADLIGTRHPGYLLQLGDARLDVRQVECEVERARAVVDQSRRQAADLLRGALARWRGPVLSEVDSRVLRPETERLEERRLELVEEWAEVALHLAAHDDRIATLSAAAAEQPLRERLHGQLMLALYSEGRQAEALAVYRALRGRLRDGLGIEPIPALRLLHEAMLRGDPGLVQARVAPPPVSRSP